MLPLPSNLSVLHSTAAKRLYFLASGAVAYETWKRCHNNHTDDGDVDERPKLKTDFFATTTLLQRSRTTRTTARNDLATWTWCSLVKRLSVLSPPVVACETSSDNANDVNDEERRFRESLAYHRSRISIYKEKWDYVTNKSSRIPTISWPSHPDDLPFPETTPLSQLRSEFDNEENDDRRRSAVAFQMAYAVMVKGARFGNDANETVTVDWAFALLKKEVAAGHADSVCLYSQLLNNGVNYKVKNNRDTSSDDDALDSPFVLEADPSAAVACLHHLLSQHPNHSQGLYELGVAYYMGEGVVEDEKRAVECFFRSVQSSKNNAAAYMIGDCLLDGVGIERDRGKALEWLITAGEWGHRGARSRVMAVLEHDEDADYGDFTDASHQTLKVPTPAEKETDTTREEEEEEEAHIDDDFADEEEEERKHWEKARDNVLLTERKFTMGGVPSVKSMLRRKTTVNASRNRNDTNEV